MVPVRSNFRLKRFSALSIFSPSLTGIIIISSSFKFFERQRYKTKIQYQIYQLKINFEKGKDFIR